MRKMILPTLVMSTAVSLAAVPSFLMTLPEAPPLPDGVAEVVEPSWQCPTCSAEEQYVLKELQAQTKITDKNALATLMGNIKQESNSSLTSVKVVLLSPMRTVCLVGMV
ncbi:hypothetical protein Syn7803US65_184 [Synechococcus phage ACG-2014d]|uniref:Uncharacterized protein n=1 Tax=Synechococcus phage ACG-2014d TaxID=1493509 RepID=A0A0E3HUY9_9CAUD|nr:hypothetical protein Syn7803US65_184 [Synechococcus phage ACG-2014d]